MDKEIERWEAPFSSICVALYQLYHMKNIHITFTHSIFYNDVHLNFCQKCLSINWNRSFFGSSR